MSEPKLIGNLRGRAPSLLVVGLAGLMPTFVRAAPVVAAKESKVYHTRPDDCGAAKNIIPQNRIEFESADAAEIQGRRKCMSCFKIEQREQREANNKSPEPPGQGEASELSGGSQVEPPEEGSAEKNPRARPIRLDGDSSRRVGIRKILPGGTIVLDSGERAALAGIVFPMPGQPTGRDAVRAARKLMRRGEFEMFTLAAPTRPAVRDRYGRLLVVLRSATDDEFDLAAELLGEGVAWLDPTLSFEQDTARERKQSDAVWSGRGIWKRFDGPAGRAQVMAGKDAFEYHPIGCPHAALLADATQVTLNEAKGRQLAPCEYVREESAP